MDLNPDLNPIIIANVIALVFIIDTTISRLNIMMRTATRLSLRVAYVSLAVGAWAALWDYDTATWQGALLHAGIAAVLLTDARKSKCYEPNRECDA